MFTQRIDDARVVEALARAAQHTAQTEPLMGRIAGIMHFEVEENFEAGGRPKWQALSPRTIAERMKEGSWPGEILRRTGGLATSVSPSHDATTARVGTNKEYGAIQHLGGEIHLAPRSSLFAQNRRKDGGFAKGRGKEARGGAGKSTFGARTIKIPARPYLVLSPAGIGKILEAVKRFIKGG